MAEQTAAAQATETKSAPASAPAAETAAEQTTPPTSSTDKTDTNEQETSSDLTTRISAAEKLAKQSAGENKKLRAELNKLRQAHMTDEERQTDNLKQREDAVNEKEAALLTEQNRFYAVQAIRKAGLDDGSEASLQIVNLITGDAPKDQTGIDERIKNFGKWMKQHDKALTDKLFKSNGRQPAGSGSPAAETTGIGVRAAQRYAQKLHLDTGGKQK